MDVTSRKDSRGSVQLEGVGAGHVLYLRHHIWIAFQCNPQKEAALTWDQLMGKCNSIQECPHRDARLHASPKGRKKVRKMGRSIRQEHRSAKLRLSKSQLHQSMWVPCKGMKIVICDEDIIHMLQ